MNILLKKKKGLHEPVYIRTQQSCSATGGVLCTAFALGIHECAHACKRALACVRLTLLFKLQSVNPLLGGCGLGVGVGASAPTLGTYLLATRDWGGGRGGTDKSRVA